MRLCHSLVSSLTLSLALSLSLSLSLFLSLCLSLSPYFLAFYSSSCRAGEQGELPRAAGGLLEVAVDGEKGRTVYNIVMIQ